MKTLIMITRYINRLIDDNWNTERKRILVEKLLKKHNESFEREIKRQQASRETLDSLEVT